MKNWPMAGLKDRYLPPALLVVLMFFGFSSLAQTYNASLHVVLNDAAAPAQRTPMDARTMFWDAANFKYRAFVSTTEVLTFLPNPINRFGQALYVVNTGGTLSGGVITGGVNALWYFKNGVADSNLVLLIPNSISCSGCLLAANNLSDLANAGTSRTNLGLGTMATQSTTATGVDITGTWPGSLTVNSIQGHNLAYLLNYTNLTNKPPAVSLTTIGSSGVATYNNTTGVLNIPNYSGGGSSCLNCNADSINQIPANLSNTRNNYQVVLDTVNNQLILVPADSIWVQTGVDSLYFSIQGRNHVVPLPGAGGGSGITTLNGLTPTTQFFATGTAGSDFAIVSSVATHTFNLPVASGSNTGKLSNTDWTTFNNKQNAITPSNTIDQYWNGFEQFVSLNTDSITEGTNHQYYTNARARAAISLTTTGSSGAATYNNTTGVLNIPNYTGGSGTDSAVLVLAPLLKNVAGTVITLSADTSAGLTHLATQAFVNNQGFIKVDSGIVNGFGIAQAISGTTKYLSFDSTAGSGFHTTGWLNLNFQGKLTLTTTGSSGAATLVGNTLNIPQYAAGTGTVTSFSFTNGNGFTGTVTNATTTPALSLAPSFTGLVSSNGSALLATTIGLDLNYTGTTLKVDTATMFPQIRATIPGATPDTILVNNIGAGIHIGYATGTKTLTLKNLQAAGTLSIAAQADSSLLLTAVDSAVVFGQFFGQAIVGTTKYINLSNQTASTLLGYNGSGVPSVITLGTNLSMSGTTLNASGGGGGLSGGNLGSGYRPYVPNLSGLKTYTSDASIAIDSSVTNQLNWVVVHPNSRPSTTVSANTTMTLVAGDYIEAIWIDPTNDIANFQVGTTPTGFDIVPGINLAAGSKNNFTVGYRAVGSVTLYFQNISSSTVITLIKQQ